MKTFKYLTLFILTALMFTGCDEDFLDKAPEHQISGPTFWRTENDLILAANNLYRNGSIFPGLALLDSRSYLFARKRSFDNISDGSYVPGGDFGGWGSNYRAIRDANIILENADNALNFGVTQGVVNRYKGEALVVRAMAYYNLVKAYGDVPFITTTLNLESPELMGPRDSRTTIVDAILADLQTASGDLPAPSALPGNDHGRITSSAAMGMRARIALYEGTREKFHSFGNANEHLQIAKQSADALISLEGTEHELFADRQALFRDGTGGETSKESILVRKYGGEQDHGASAWLRNADVNPTKSMADMYLDNTGLPITHPSSVFLGYGTITSEYRNRDSRMNQDLLEPYTYDNFSGSNPNNPDIAGGNPGQGYIIQKMFNADKLFQWNEQNDRILLRYAEILLIYAEATFELDGSISDEDLDKSINKLRARVGMPDLTNAFVTTNGLDMREEIRRERTVELYHEGYEWDDIMRWKTAEIVQSRALKGFMFHQSEYPTVEVSTTREDGKLLVDNEGFLLWQEASQRDFDPGKHYLFPLPLGEIELNPNLSQNPGW